MKRCPVYQKETTGAGAQLRLAVTVVGFEESRDIHAIHGENGRVVDVKPVEGSERAFLDLELPGGEVVRVEASSEAFQKVMLALSPSPPRL